MIRPTPTALKMVTTMGGMRRMLKRRPSPVSYIRAAVQAGTYRDPEEIHLPDDEGNRGGARRTNRDNRPKPERYPKQYEILSLNPPVPTSARITKKDQRTLTQLEGKERIYNRSNRTKHQHDHLVKSYLRRYDNYQRTNNMRYQPSEEEEQERYYRSLLGIPVASRSERWDTAMGRKSTVLSRAYEFAIRQKEVLQRNHTINERESAKIVETLLSEEEQDERWRVRKKAEDVVSWRMRHSSTVSNDNESKLEQKKQKEVNGENKIPMDRNNGTMEIPGTIPSILFGKPRTIQAMHLWGQRLDSVPYSEWTVGAATALDHWIAVDVLGMSEETWDRLLSGELESDVEDALVAATSYDGKEESVSVPFHVGNLARGQDIVDVRIHMFPETVISAVKQEQENEIGMMDNMDLEMLSNDYSNVNVDKKKDDGTIDIDGMERDIDILLASLSSFGHDDGDNDDESSRTKNEKEFTRNSSSDIVSDDIDTRIHNMLHKLQEWRSKNQECPYSDWYSDEKTKFMKWLKEYIALVSLESDGKVDMVGMREALLSEPPISSEQNQSFWSRIKDETDAELYLQELLKNGMPPETIDGKELSKGEKHVRNAYRTFLSLPYEKQLAKLVNMGSLRPILDEYTNESHRDNFLQMYGEMLLEGVEMEHLVSDKHGPIGLDKVGHGLLPKDHTLPSNEKFRIQNLPWGIDQYGTARSERAKTLYRAWNLHKSGRARYEEELFRMGQIGLKESRHLKDEGKLVGVKRQQGERSEP